MQDVIEWILEGEEWLIRRILLYAKRQGYTRYTSTLEDAWRISIRELSAAVTEALARGAAVAEFEPDEAFTDDPASAFAMLEAGRHRERGIELRMFLGLFKYYRQIYLDRIAEGELTGAQQEQASFLVTRIFDRMEIAFCSEWTSLADGLHLCQLQGTNRRMTNEKNRFLTVTESLGSPVLLMDDEGRLTYFNQAAARILGAPTRSGSYYHDTKAAALPVPSWLAELHERSHGTGSEHRVEHQAAGPHGMQVYEVLARPMLDVSDRMEGIVVIMHDITTLRQTEAALSEKASELERLSYTDPLTGLLNRRGLFTRAEELLHRARRTDLPLVLLYCDVDHLKMINDRFGHAMGDAALVALSKALERSFPAEELIARIGGDEFVALLEHRQDQYHDRTTRRLHDNLSEELGSLGQRLELSFTAGWATFDPGRHGTFDELLAEADTTMYTNKRLRRQNPTTRHSRAHQPG